jgi:bacterial/archaeal transporter family protein
MMGSWLFWSLLSAAFAGATAVLTKVGVTGISSNLAFAIRTTVVLLFSWTIVKATGTSLSFASIPKRAWVFLVISGFATALSWLCYFRALQLGPASKVAPVDKLSVIIVIALSAFFLHEPVGWKQWAGGLLVLGGSALIAL